MAFGRNNTRKDSSTQYATSHIKSVIKGLGLEIASETGNDFLSYCPFHNNRHTPSFSISKEYGAFICFNPACAESGTMIELIKKILRKNDYEALRYVAAKETESLNNFDEMLSEILQEQPDFKEFSQEVLDNLHEQLKINNKAIEYFASRKINMESITHFKLGYSANMNMVTVPVHSPDGVPIGLVGRSIEGKSFKNSSNLPKSKTMFNIHRAKRIGSNVIVVESSFDAIRIHQAGFPNVVATLGGFLSTEQHYLLNRYFNKIIIMTDVDEAGRELGKSISNKLRNKDILWASHSYGKIYPNNAKDAGDMSDEDIKSCITNAVSDIEYRSWNP